jgi:hypothetical protein
MSFTTREMARGKHVADFGTFPYNAGSLRQGTSLLPRDYVYPKESDTSVN